MATSRAIAAASLAALFFLAGCGSTGPQVSGSQEGTAAGGTGTPRSEEVLRDRILAGVGEDFRRGTQAGPRGFGLCIRLGMRRALDRATLLRLLLVVRRPDGAAYGAQALNELAVPVGDACGGRRFVPELTAAGAVLRGARMVDSRAHRIGLEYGPYIGVSCRHAPNADCDRVGIDLVLRRTARSVSAVVAGRVVRLVTPGPVPHDADAAGRDWGGFIDGVGFRRESSPFYIPVGGYAPGHWAGNPPVYLPVRIAIAYSGGRRDRIAIPSVFLSPGFG